jgi:hypothetical protein
MSITPVERTVRHGETRCSAVQCSATQSDATRYGTIRDSMGYGMRCYATRDAIAWDTTGAGSLSSVRGDG